MEHPKDKPFAKLRGRILERMGTQAAFADAIGIHPATLNTKLNGKSDWTAKEIATCCCVLDIPIAEAHEYFFIL